MDKFNFTPGPWYAKNTAGDHQGLVIEEGTGRTIALTYEPDDAPKLAALPDLVAALERIAAGQEMSGEFTHAETVLAYQEIARAALAKVKG